MKTVPITLCRTLVVAAVLALLGAPAAATEDKVPAEYQGDWVPEKGTCESPVRFRIAETRMTLINGKDSASYGGIGITHTFFGPDYQGISFVAMPELDSGNAPFTVFFNADEKKGVTKVDIYQEIKGTQNAQVKAIQAAAKKLSERFPLNNIPLKKCAAE
jgi:hypothetical protein